VNGQQKSELKLVNQILISFKRKLKNTKLPEFDYTDFKKQQKSKFNITRLSINLFSEEMKLRYRNKFSLGSYTDYEVTF
jgi:hypothetical protein